MRRVPFIAIAGMLGLSSLWAQTPAWNNSLSNLPPLTPARTRSVSPENPIGEKGKGGMAIPNPNDPDLPAGLLETGDGGVVILGAQSFAGVVEDGCTRAARAAARLRKFRRENEGGSCEGER